MLKRFALAVSVLMSCSLFAAPALDRPMTLTELVDIALENHPSTKQAWWNARRAAAGVGIAKSAYYPKLGVEGRVIHGRDFKDINGPNVNYTIVGGDLTLSMLLFDQGERSASVDAAKMSLEAAGWQNNWVIQKVMVKVLENAFAAIHAQEVYQAALVSLKDAQQMREIAEQLNQSGLGSIADVHVSRAAFSQMKIELSQQKADLDIRRAKLAISLGLPADTCFELAPLVPLRPTQILQTEQLLCSAREQRADLMAKRAKLAESIANADKVRASYGPKVSLAGRGGAAHAVHDKTDEGHYQISLNFEMPLFKGFETMYKNRTAYADTQLSMEELAELELEISLEVLTAGKMLEAAHEMMPLVDEYLDNSLKAYESVIGKYKAGKEGIAELSNAQRQLAAARVRYSDVKTRWLVSVANLAYATGTLAPYMEKRCER